MPLPVRMRAELPPDPRLLRPRRRGAGLRVARPRYAARADPGVAGEAHHVEVAALRAFVVEVAVGEVVAADELLDAGDEPRPPMSSLSLASLGDHWLADPK